MIRGCATVKVQQLTFPQLVAFNASWVKDETTGFFTFPVAGALRDKREKPAVSTRFRMPS